eukprot:gene8823-8003_t
MWDPEGSNDAYARDSPSSVSCLTFRPFCSTSHHLQCLSASTTMAGASILFASTGLLAQATAATEAAVADGSAPTPPTDVGTWTRYLLTEAAAAAGAVCLDGSPGGYYLRSPLPGAPAGPARWVVFHEGGGWCGSDAGCAQRANTSLGSSTFWPEVPPGTLPPGV